MIKIDKEIGKKIDHLIIKYGENEILNYFYDLSVINVIKSDFEFLNYLKKEEKIKLINDGFNYENRKEILEEVLMNFLKTTFDNKDYYYVSNSGHGGYKKTRNETINFFENFINQENVDVYDLIEEIEEKNKLDEIYSGKNKMWKRGRNQVINKIYFYIYNYEKLIKKIEEKNYWNYRIVKTVFSGEESFDICEVHYENDIPISYSIGKNILSQNSMEDLKWSMDEISKAFEKEVLIFKDNKFIEKQEE